MSGARTDPHAHALGPGRAADAPRTDPSTLAAFAPAAAPSAPVQGSSRVHSSAANSVGSYGQPAGFARPLQRVIPPQQHRLAGSPLARPPASAQPPRWQSPAQSSTQAGSPRPGPPPTVHGQRMPMSKLLLSTSQEGVQQALQAMRNVVQTFANAEQLNIQSGKAVSAAYNAQPAIVRNSLWTDWNVFSTLCRSLGAPVFPIQPDKVALVLAAYASLPISSYLRGVAQVTQPPPPADVVRVFEALNIAAGATRHLWPDVPCFIRSAEGYDSTAVLDDNLQAMLRPSSSARPGPVSSFYNRPASQQPSGLQFARPQQRPPPPPSRDSFTSRPLLTQVPPAPPPPALVTPPPDQFIQPAVEGKPERDDTLRTFSKNLSAVLEQLQTESDDLEAFNLAQERFQRTINTKEWSARAASVFNTVLLYTHITALLRFPTYPLTTPKLALFALAMTPGPLGAQLDAAAPELSQKRECPRATGKQLEGLLKDVTAVRMITRGGDEQIPDDEKSGWRAWWKEITDDWKGKGKKYVALWSESDVSVASTSRLPAKKGRAPRSRAEPASRSGSPAVSVTGSKGKGRPTPKWLEVYTSASTTSSTRGSSVTARLPSPPPLDSFPRWVPDQLGSLPKDRREPPLPLIMDSPWFVPKKRRDLRAESADGSASASASASGSVKEGGGAEVVVSLLAVPADSAAREPSAAKESDDEETAAKKVKGRSVALHRPRRGGTDMRPFDISSLW
ncbi:hypothetical protein Rhopal_006254-T1 [Rhodotorula paludigena]|uniref:Proteophosphoglycan ppg4 n=1 Tax=Rhodotorula paludigena TaxID=86838 RepID=A0AAV5GV30_9BASI|nr:hypothetical protein Rhopal_006254-T1 [Rhodotorula paludigena]